MIISVKITTKQHELSSLIEEIQTLLSEINLKEKELHSGKYDLENSVPADHLMRLRITLGEKQGLQHEAEFDLLRLHGDLIAEEATALSHQYEEALEKLLVASENYEAMKVEFESLNSQIISLENLISKKIGIAQDYFDKARHLESRVV